ncbi:hypothetical protein F5Y16DRAFT_417331 [Xylariaceae sp. FL0255]|nr:hypothetical protein F5Y16DRAFT_417331 [Xylariaceae sp. FL0255]
MASPKNGGDGNPSQELDKYSELWDRFYEQLILLNSLGQTRGSHSSPPEPKTLYRVLNNLSYICDSEKEGNSVTAIGLEDGPTSYVFWAGSNNASKGRSNVKFLNEVLSDIRTITVLKEAFVAKCLKHAYKRVKKEAKLLQKEIKFLNPHLKDGALVSWLENISLTTHHSKLCHHAYRIRHDDMMKRLDTQAKDLGNILLRPSTNVRHYIGRLAHHIRAPNELMDDFFEDSQMRKLLDKSKVQWVPSVKCIPLPKFIQAPMQADPSLISSKDNSNNNKNNDDENHSIFGILMRMLQASKEMTPDMATKYKIALGSMDKDYNLQQDVLDKYTGQNLKPIVHAEIQVLEHFHSKGMKFFNNDRFIGCSKPACYCCHLYMLNHPAQCVVPETHQKLYLNWGLCALSGVDDPRYEEQRDVLNKMVEAIRGDALDQIIRETPRLPRRHDSVAGISPVEDVRHAAWRRNRSIQVADTSGSRHPDPDVASHSCLSRALLSSGENEDRSEAKTGSDYDRDSNGVVA